MMNLIEGPPDGGVCACTCTCTCEEKAPSTVSAVSAARSIPDVIGLPSLRDTTIM